MSHRADDREGDRGGAGQGRSSGRGAADNGRPGNRSPWRALADGVWESSFGLGTALCFSVSPVFLKLGLARFPSPTVAVGLGLLSATVTYAVLLLVTGKLKMAGAPAGAAAGRVQIAAGVFIALGTWLRYVAIGMVPIAIVSTLGRVNIPVVLLLSPLLLAGRKERVTVRLWLGAGLIIAGAAVVTLR